MGGQGSGVVRDDAELSALASIAFARSPEVLVEESLHGWKEVEYEVVRDSAGNVITTLFAVINADDYYGQAAYSRASDFMKNAGATDAFGLVAYTLSDTLSPHGSVYS